MIIATSSKVIVVDFTVDLVTHETVANYLNFMYCLQL